MTCVVYCVIILTIHNHSRIKGMNKHFSQKTASLRSLSNLGNRAIFNKIFSNHNLTFLFPLKNNYMLNALPNQIIYTTPQTMALIAPSV